MARSKETGAGKFFVLEIWKAGNNNLIGVPMSDLSVSLTEYSIILKSYCF